MGRDLTYSTAKARTELGWLPALGYRESIERTVRWYLDGQPASDALPRAVAGPA
jgi:dTDP-D-glucose 4,6-dehydratase